MNTKSTTDIDRTVGLRIPLTKGMFALVDEADFAEVSATKWSLSQTRSGWYAVRVGHREEGGFGRIYMHRQIIKPPPGVLVDHRSGDGLDNRRDNLRRSTRSGNQHNRFAVGGTSDFKGVSWHAAGRKWQAHIAAKGGRRYLGLHATEEAAARAYDAAALELHGEFARLNFPMPGEVSAIVRTAVRMSVGPIEGNA